MVTERRIQRHELTSFLKVFNRFTDKPMGYLGNASEGCLVLISHLPLLVEADFQLRFKLPGSDGQVHLIDLVARCLWCREDVTPNVYDSGFILYQPPEEYLALIDDLHHYFSFHPRQASA